MKTKNHSTEELISHSTGKFPPKIQFFTVNSVVLAATTLNWPPPNFLPRSKISLRIGYQNLQCFTLELRQNAVDIQNGASNAKTQQAVLRKLDKFILRSQGSLSSLALTVYLY